jgi:hypothetical protein
MWYDQLALMKFARQLADTWASILSKLVGFRKGCDINA